MSALAEKQEKSCCFSGHREISSSLVLPLREALDREIRRLSAEGFVWFWAGGAKGFDTLAALEVLYLQAEGLPVKLALALPCPEQAEGWSRRDRAEYETVKQAADRVEMVSQSYERGCMQKRNRRLVEESSLCVCWLAHDGGGTQYTVNYAKKKGIPVVNLAEKLGAVPGPVKADFV